VSADQPAPVTAGSRRINPFAFPSDTDVRFFLLIVSLLGTSLYIFNVLYFSLIGGGMGALSVYAQCDERATRLALALARRSGGAEPSSLLAWKAAAADQCTGPFGGTTAAWMLGGVALLLAVTWLIYWTLPAWMQRRRQLAPLTSEDAPEVAAHLLELSAEAGLSHPPRFVWNPLDATTGALAFGRAGAYYVALAGGLVTQFYTDPAAFRAVLRHELAHLRNGDVDKTYLAVATWRAFVVVALIPYLLSLFGQPLDWAVSVTWRVLALALLVYVTRSAVLRARELFADARAAAGRQVAQDLARVLQTLPFPDEGRLTAGARIRQALSVHPDPRDRIRALDEPQRLLRMGFWEPFGAGIASAIALPHVVTLLSLLTAGGQMGLLTPVVGAAVLLAPLAVGVAGLGIWRTAFRSIAGDPAGEMTEGTGGLGWGREWLRIGVGLGLGLAAGRILSFDAVVSAPSANDAGQLSLASSSLFEGCVDAALLAGALLLSWWLATSAHRWIGRALSAARSPLGPCFLSLAVAGGALVVWLSVLRAAGALAGFLWPLTTLLGFTFDLTQALLGGFTVAAHDPSTLVTASVATTGLLALLVTGRTWWRRAPAAVTGTGATWAFLDRSTAS
jgi:Zn-dependent protease with chaperone function